MNHKQLEKIPNEILLNQLLSHPDFAHFRKSGSDDWRDPNEENPPLSLSSKGWYDHKTGDSGSLDDLARKRDLLEVPQDPLNIQENRDQKGQSDTTKQAERLWKQEESQPAKERSQHYLSEQRKIPIENYKDLLGDYLRCVEGNQGREILLCPMLTPDQRNSAEAGSSFSAEKVHWVILLEGDRYEKKQLGSPSDGVGRISYLPPLSENCESPQYLVIEGLEDALSIRSRYRDHHFLVCQSKGNLKHVPEFLTDGAEVLILSDHDGHANPNENGEHAAAELCQQLLRSGYECTALMPAEAGDDANKALQEERLDEWSKSLQKVPELPKEVMSKQANHPNSTAVLEEEDLQEPDFDVAAVIGELPVIPRGILPKELEIHLELSAKQLDLNYEAAFCQFLVNGSIALGGRKRIRIEETNNEGTWTENSCLWLASVGPTGFAKTPLNRKCGGVLLDKQQDEWQKECEKEVENWEKLESSSSPKPKRKRWTANKLTIETLIALHSENPAGIGFVSDEILGILNGLGQFKGGRGNDKQIILSLWNGYDFENPTADSDRYVRDVYVPMSGGIQDKLLSEIINDANTSDGLAARFLFNYLVLAREPVSVKRNREISRILSEDDRGWQIMKGIFQRLAEIRDSEQQILMDESARDHLEGFAYYLKKEARQGPEQMFSPYMKLRTYLYRIALLLHYLTVKNPDNEMLSEQTALNTLSIMEFFIGSMKRAYGAIDLTDKELKMKKILNKLHQLGGRAKPKDIKQPIKKTVSCKEASELIKELVEKEVLQEVLEGKEKFIELVNK